MKQAETIQPPLFVLGLDGSLRVCSSAVDVAMTIADRSHLVDRVLDARGRRLNLVAAREGWVKVVVDAPVQFEPEILGSALLAAQDALDNGEPLEELVGYECERRMSSELVSIRDAFLNALSSGGADQMILDALTKALFG